MSLIPSTHSINHKTQVSIVVVSYSKTIPFNIIILLVEDFQVPPILALSRSVSTEFQGSSQANQDRVNLYLVPRQTNTGVIWSILKMRSLMLLAYAGIVSAASYSLVAFAPDTKVNGATLNAVGQSLYTGTSGPATYCPSDTVPTCPDVHGTLVSSGLTSMAVSSSACFIL